MKKENTLKRGQLYWMILETIILGILAGGGHPLRPTLPIMFKEIVRLLKQLKQVEIEEKKVKVSLAKLEKNNIINIQEEGNDVYVHLIANNEPVVFKYSIKALLDLKKKTKTWNGKWFMVFFDVPEIQRNKRIYLRRFLTKIGFYRYQKSVYLFPYECEEEIKLIKKIVETAKYMSYIIAEKIEKEEEAKTYFHLN